MAFCRKCGALSIAGIVLGCAARSKGSRSKVTKASLVLGIISICLFIVLLLIFAIYE